MRAKPYHKSVIFYMVFFGAGGMGFFFKLSESMLKGPKEVGIDKEGDTRYYTHIILL